MPTDAKPTNPTDVMPCVLQAGNMDGFIRECIAEAKTQATLRITALGLTDTEAVTRTVCEATAEAVLRRMVPDLTAELVGQKLDAHLPAALAHARQINGEHES